MNSVAQPKILPLPDLLQALGDAREGSDIRFCFVLGSGASVSSDIPTGARLVDAWLQDLFRSHQPGHPEGELARWAEERFGFAWANRAESYGQVYKARFPENANGQAELRKLIRGRAPSFGYHALAQVLSRTRHNVVITTNFDNLVEDALVAHGEPSFTARSAADATFLVHNDHKPRILKIHGDIDRETYNADALIESLDQRWVFPLSIILGQYTPIFLGYGGCDPGFMSFLTTQYQGGLRHKPIWTYRVEPSGLAPVLVGAPPGMPTTALAESFVTKHDAWWAPTPGFDELMLLLAPRLGVEHSGKAISAVADRSRAVYDKSLTAASRGARQSVSGGSIAWCPQLDRLVRDAETHLLGPAAGRRWREWEEYVHASTTPDEQIERGREAFSWLPDDPRASATLALALHERHGTSSEAETLMATAIEIARSFGSDSAEFLDTLEYEGLWRYRRGDVPAAEGLLHEALERRQEVLGLEHPDTLVARNNLASVQNVRGMHADAESEFRAVLALQTRLLGAEHPNALASRINIASAMDLQGKSEEAEAELRLVLAIQERLRGPEHLDTLTTRSRLAGTLSTRGQHSEAESSFRAVLAIQERVLGVEHAATQESRNYLAGVLHAQEKYVEAESEHRALLALQERLLGSEHPDTLTSRNNVAGAVYDQGRYAEAAVDFGAVHAARERVLGPEHPDTLSSRIHVASILEAQGKYTEAETEHRAVLALRERVLGPEHPLTLSSRSHVAGALFLQGKQSDAEAEHRAVLSVQERVLGSEHPSTLSSRSNLANTLAEQAKYEDAETEYRLILRLREGLSGPEHPATMAMRGNLARCLNAAGRHNEAEAEYRAVHAVEARLRGPDHPNTLTTLHNIAATLSKQGDHAAAEDLYRAVLMLQTSVVGPEHPDTLTTRSNLSITLCAQEKFAAAAVEIRAVLELRERVLGPDHPATLDSREGLRWLMTAQSG